MGNRETDCSDSKQIADWFDDDDELIDNNPTESRSQTDSGSWGQVDVFNNGGVYQVVDGEGVESENHPLDDEGLRYLWHVGSRLFHDPEGDSLIYTKGRIGNNDYSVDNQYHVRMGGDGRLSDAKARVEDQVDDTRFFPIENGNLHYLSNPSPQGAAYIKFGNPGEQAERSDEDLVDVDDFRRQIERSVEDGKEVEIGIPRAGRPQKAMMASYLDRELSECPVMDGGSRQAVQDDSNDYLEIEDGRGYICVTGPGQVSRGSEEEQSSTLSWRDDDGLSALYKRAKKLF